MARRTALVLVSFSLLASACSPDRGEDASPPVELDVEPAANLEPFQGCDQLLDYFRESAETLERELLPGVPGVRVGSDVVAVAEATGAGDGAPSGAGLLPPTAGTEFSGTNVQEAGVDEPDIVKTDGRRIVTVAQGRLEVVDAAGAGVHVLGSAALPPGSHELFLDGDRAIVLTRSWDVVALGGTEIAGDVIGPGSSSTVVSALDLSDPRKPVVVDSATFEGDYVAARLHEGVVRLVLRSGPAFLGGPEDATLEHWLPDQVIEGEGGAASTRPLVPCESVTRPPEPSGVGTVTVVTLDAGGSMQPIDTDAVVADAQTVYASTRTLYVATNQWIPSDDVPARESSTTELHAFDISEPGQTTYLASGRVRGQLLNQWSLSEYREHLRVATTDGSPWAPADGEPSSESFLTVLARNGDALEALGQVGGLGRGEQIQAVRFIGDLGFVVTFRQTDPLYAVDLSDPADPRLLGELKIPGFSAYLHPIGDGRLLGVGQDATDEGRRLGTQVSLFDVSDPVSLRRLDQTGIDNASSALEYDHRAFLWWPRRNLAVLPIEIYGPPVAFEPGIAPGVEPVPDIAAVQSFLGVAAFRVERDKVEEVGRVSHAARVDTGWPIQRALVVGDSLYTVSEAGIMANDLDSLDEQGWAAF